MVGNLDILMDHFYAGFVISTVSGMQAHHKYSLAIKVCNDSGRCIYQILEMWR